MVQKSRITTVFVVETLYINNGINLPYQLHLGCIKTYPQWDKPAISTGDRRISEPSTVSSIEKIPTWNLKHPLKTTVVSIGWWTIFFTWKMGVSPFPSIKMGFFNWINEPNLPIGWVFFPSTIILVVEVWSCGSDTSKAILSDATLSLDLRNFGGWMGWTDGVREGGRGFLGWIEVIFVCMFFVIQYPGSFFLHFLHG